MVAGGSSLSYTESEFRIVCHSVIAQFAALRSHQDLSALKETDVLCALIGEEELRHVTSRLEVAP